MRIELTHKMIGKVDEKLFQKIVDKVDSLTEDEWDKDPRRQNKFGVHKHTTSLIFKFNWMPDDPFEPVWKEWKTILSPLFEQCEKEYGPFKGIVRMVLARLPAGTSIKEHVDGFYMWDYAHRIHLPIKTVPGCDFIISGKKIDMPAGHLIEINNKAKHGVRNNGTQDRVHLIFDFIDEKGYENIMNNSRAKEFN